MSIRSFFKRLKFFGNFLFIVIALILFIFNLIKYSDDYLRRDTYQLNQTDQLDSFALIKKDYDVNQTILFFNCSSQFSKYDAENTFRWFLASSTHTNRAFHVFFWFLMIVALIIAIIPSLAYINMYCISNHYNRTDRYCLSSINHLIRSLLSTTAVLLPSFYMNTFDWTSTPCLDVYPTRFPIVLFPFIFATLICLIIFFLGSLFFNRFYDQWHVCCKSEGVSCMSLCVMGFLLVGIVVVSVGVIGIVFVISFIEEPLRLHAILVAVQLPFVLLQPFVD